MFINPVLAPRGLCPPAWSRFPAGTMDAPPRRVPFSTLAAASNNFRDQIGEGATGAVFSGALDGAPIALKRLNLAKDATPSIRAALTRAFHSEFAVLGAYRHARLVRLLCYAIDEAPDAPHPFALAFELLEEGSLADWLRGTAGEPPKRCGPGGAPLTPVQRLDAALGAASGLAFLHGQREPGEAGAAGPPTPVLHRDVKSANIGLTRTSGALFSKVLDCGLARALKGGAAGEAAAAAAGGSSTGSIVGTPGFMAPEVATGAYSIRSDVYALGVVLMELLKGKRAAPTEALAVEKAARRGGGVASLAAQAEPCWPAAAAEGLARLALSCIAVDAEDRPGSMGEVGESLRALRALVAVPGGAPLAGCAVCLEQVDGALGVACAPPPQPPPFCVSPVPAGPCARGA